MKYQLTFGRFYMCLNVLAAAVSAQLQLCACVQSVGVLCSKQQRFAELLHRHNCALCFCVSFEFEEVMK